MGECRERYSTGIMSAWLMVTVSPSYMPGYHICTYSVNCEFVIYVGLHALYDPAIRICQNWRYSDTNTVMSSINEGIIYLENGLH